MTQPILFPCLLPRPTLRPYMNYSSIPNEADGSLKMSFILLEKRLHAMKLRASYVKCAWYAPSIMTWY